MDVKSIIDVCWRNGFNAYRDNKNKGVVFGTTTRYLGFIPYEITLEELESLLTEYSLYCLFNPDHF